MNKREKAYEYIRQRILDGALPRTTSEREIEDLAAQEGIELSRTPIREALAVLAATGLIEQVPQVGARVRNIDAAEAVRTLRLRSGMETVMVDELASHEQPEIDAAQKALQCMSEAVPDKPFAFQLADTEFHVAIALGAGFFSAQTSLQGLRDRIHLYRLGANLEESAMQAVLDEHRALLDRIAGRDRERAVHALNEHLTATATRIDPELDSDAFLRKSPVAVGEREASRLMAGAAAS